MGAKDLKAVTFLLDLTAFPEKVQAGDLACDGYEPWSGGWGTCGNYFCLFGSDSLESAPKIKLHVPVWILFDAFLSC